MRQAGYAEVNDDQQLSQDQTFRLAAVSQPPLPACINLTQVFYQANNLVAGRSKNGSSSWQGQPF